MRRSLVPLIRRAHHRTSGVTAPTYQSVGTVASGYGTFPITVTSPQAVVNDIGLLFIVTTSSNPPTPSGWNLCLGCPVATSGQPFLNVYWQRATATGTLSATIPSGYGAAAGVIGLYSGCRSTGDPTEGGVGVVTASSSTTVAIPATTTLGSNRLVILSAATMYASGTPTAITNSILANLATRADTAGISFGDGLLVAAGSSGTSQMTTPTAGPSNGHAIALVGI